ncbi:MAG: hypothetical protein M3063_03740 [Actinomycetota bacterium]|nr:hypothetical protein [Actinomycetota bacterium]
MGFADSAERICGGTSVPGLHAAGDTTAMPSVANAIASGSVAAAMIVHDLVAEARGLSRAA